MNNRDNARYDTFKRVIAFRDVRLAQFPAGSKAAGEFALVETAKAAMDAADSKQSGGKQMIKGGTTNKEVLVDALRLDLRNLAATARSIAEKEKNPGFAENFRLPDSPGEGALLTAARLFEKNATPLAAKFLAYELPADFLTNLADDVKAIDDANKQQDSGLDEQTGGTAGIGTAIRNGLAAVLQLNTIMHNKYARDAENLRAWMSASHTERAPQREKKPTPPPSAPTPPPTN